MDRRIGIRLGMFFAAAALYVWALSFCRLAGEGQGLVYMALEQTIDTPAAEEIFEREGEEETPAAFCFWGETRNQRLSCRETGSSAQVTVVSLSGNPELVGAGSLAWQDGCFLDEKTAQTLFGTTHCGGQMLWYGGRACPVLGTVSALEPTMVTMAEDGDLLNRCVLSAPAEKGKSLGSQFLMRWGLRGSVLDFFPLWALTKDLLLLFPWVLLFSIGLFLWKDCRKWSLFEVISQKKWPILLKGALSLGILALSLWWTSRHLVIPPDLIPSRWSDFSFWGNWWNTQRENFRGILVTPLGSRQLQILLNMVKSMGSSIAAALLALGAVRRRKYADIVDRG